VAPPERGFPCCSRLQHEDDDEDEEDWDNKLALMSGEPHPTPDFENAGSSSGSKLSANF
jgi:hypothetical protein